MGSIYLWAKGVSGYRMEVKEPVRPFALSHLAATGMFDRIVLEHAGIKVEVEGADLIRYADQVAPRGIVD